MSDELEIMHGGAIAVDSDQLRAVAEALVALAPGFANAASAVRRAHAWLMVLPSVSLRVDTSALWASADRLSALHEECRSAGENTRLMADVYELVERRAELSALEIQGMTVPEALYDRIDELVDSDPRVAEMEVWLLAAWKNDRFDGLDEQFDPEGLGQGPIVGPLFAAAAAAGARGFGRIPPGTTLAGSAGPVSVTPIRTGSPAAPPGSLAEGLGRIPEGSAAQLKVEKYTMPDGSKKFVLYSKGTQPSLDPKEPFDMRSNIDLYFRQESASYVATTEALAAAGAEPGDEIHVYAHSQGAMNAAYLVSQSEYDVSVMVTAGSPVHVTADEGRLLVEVRHPDDIVNSLAGGGRPDGSGSPDSVVISRDGSPIDMGLPAHMLDNYIETAALADQSGDVRLEAWREKANELTRAVSIESTEYVAKRE
ncbi:hypothetical protein AB0269_09535 [Microbacterium sp. NPDC077644]|uniref:hypothetical protein n=1 Tax=Microbacterium sp. NPDC077644 TaxID=3155055 RepID=UPI00344C493C